MRAWIVRFNYEGNYGSDFEDEEGCLVSLSHQNRRTRGGDRRDGAERMGAE